MAKKDRPFYRENRRPLDQQSAMSVKKIIDPEEDPNRSPFTEKELSKRSVSITEQKEFTIEVKTLSLNVREFPSLDSKSLGVVREGDRLKSVAPDKENNFYKIVYKDGFGYVHSDFVETVDFPVIIAEEIIEVPSPIEGVSEITHDSEEA